MTEDSFELNISEVLAVDGLCDCILSWYALLSVNQRALPLM
jgi:hypothetical protein